MKVIISMSGMSSRFTNAGYKEPKFMIDVDGKKVIEHIVDLYPIDSDFIGSDRSVDSDSDFMIPNQVINWYKVSKSIFFKFFNTLSLCL